MEREEEGGVANMLGDIIPDRGGGAGRGGGKPEESSLVEEQEAFG